MDEYIIPKQSKLKKFFRPLSVKILSVVIAVLICAVGTLSYMLYEKHTRVVAANATITETNDELNKTKSELENTKKELETKESENSALQGELKASKEENEELKEKIKGLEEKIAQLQKQLKSYQKAEELSSETKYPTISVPIANKGEKACYLTFDDGPSKNTLEILDILDVYGIKATFFVTCTGTTKYIENIKNAGHSIGLHTATHNYSKIYESEEAYFEDLAQISAAVEKYAGIKSMLIRFPGGSSNVISKKYSENLMKTLVSSVEEKGYDYFDWNVDSGDASKAKPTAEYIMDYIKKDVGSKKDICVLMHDSAAKSGTVEALPEMIEWLVSQGYRFEALTNDSPTFHHNIKN